MRYALPIIIYHMNHKQQNHSFYESLMALAACFATNFLHRIRIDLNQYLAIFYLGGCLAAPTKYLYGRLVSTVMA